jgi:hypothetical protein
MFGSEQVKKWCKRLLMNAKETGSVDKHGVPLVEVIVYHMYGPNDHIKLITTHCLE